MQAKIQELDVLFASLPSKRMEDLDGPLSLAKANRLDTVIVLDDNPTGAQTIYDVPVLTNWTKKVIQKEMEKQTPLFFILTNTRSLSEGNAEKLAFEIGQNICKAAQATNTRFWVISRSDSTLRGHYPVELDALELGLGLNSGIQFIVPAFIEGGRYTVDNIHYVQRKNQLVPVSQTPYARDVIFGYQCSNLKEWVNEKTNGVVPAHEVEQISLNELRLGSLENLVDKINQMEVGTTCIVNAADYADLKFFALAILRVEIQPILRTAASFISALAIKTDRQLLKSREFVTPGDYGGLIIAGSYVPTTSLQLKHLFENYPEVIRIEVDVQALIQNTGRKKMAAGIAQKIDREIQEGKNVVLYTSRKLVISYSKKENRKIAKSVSGFLAEVVCSLQVHPVFLLTKGGITSSEIATEGLGVKRSIVLGQIIKGVPVWKLGTETKFPGLSQIIFPGNVGTESSLTEIMKKLDQ